MKVFKSREEAEKAGFSMRAMFPHRPFRRIGDSVEEWEEAIIRTDLEAQLAEALEATLAEWDRLYPSFPQDDKYEEAEFGAFLKARAALRAFRGATS